GEALPLRSSASPPPKYPFPILYWLPFTPPQWSTFTPPLTVIVVSVLEEFFKRLKKSKALREELRLEIRAHRGFLSK
ncbi:MAG: hypothetical protein ABSA33_02005, partial [Candidatus Micrarchaeaceae archaeon]